MQGLLWPRAGACAAMSWDSLQNHGQSGITWRLLRAGQAPDARGTPGTGREDGERVVPRSAEKDRCVKARLKKI